MILDVGERLYFDDTVAKELIVFLESAVAIALAAQLTTAFARGLERVKIVNDVCFEDVHGLKEGAHVYTLDREGHATHVDVQVVAGRIGGRR